MVIRTSAVSGNPQIHPAADIYDSSQVVGDARIDSGVSVAPGVTVRADTGAPIFVGADTSLQEGVLIQTGTAGRILGDDQQDYGVWIGPYTVLTPKVIVQGPVYVGANCFVGFRSTLMNARIGAGCIVMMHALVQDVEVPPGKFVPSGAVVNDQDQADRLPDIQPADLAFAQEILGGRTLAFGKAAPAAKHWGQTPNQELKERDGLNTMQSQKLTPEIVQQVRQLLAQGYRIGTEHADRRRYRSNVWQTCTPIQSTREADVLAALEACLAEHADEYVRMFGIDPQAKRRVAPVTIQRPGEGAVHIQPASVSSSPSPRRGQAAHTAGVGSLPGDVVQQVRQLLNQGFKIGTEHADTRRYRSNVWKTCSPINSSRESEVLSALEACLAEHAGEYIRMFGIDPKAKRRVAPVTIQRPDGKPVEVNHKVSASNGQSPRSTSSQSTSPSGRLSGEAIQQIRQFLNQGYRIGAEYADSRRYRSNVWQTCPPVESKREGEVVAAIESCMAAHGGEYVRVFGIDPKAKRRISAITVQRPGQSSASASSAPRSAPSPSAAPSQNGYQSNGSSGQSIPADLAQQVRQLVNQGYRVGLEHADARRYRSGAWQSGGSLEGSQSDVLSALQDRLQKHSGEYVRLIGIDPQAKRRVLETTIQRP